MSYLSVKLGIPPNGPVSWTQAQPTGQHGRTGSSSGSLSGGATCPDFSHGETSRSYMSPVLPYWPHVIFLRQPATSGRLSVLAVNIVCLAESYLGSQETQAPIQAVWPTMKISLTDMYLSFSIAKWRFALIYFTFLIMVVQR